MRHYLDYYGYLLGPAPRGDGGCHSARGPHDRRELHYRPRLPRPDAAHRVRQLHAVRELLDSLKSWIDGRLHDIIDGRIANPERTMACYWLKNAGDGANFSRKDIVFECFHNFVALGQWGITIYGSCRA